MKCPFCDELEDKVVDSRMAKEGELIRRRRECLGCKRRYTTYERVEEILPVVVKKDGRRETFDRSKILSGLKKACEKRPISTATIEAVTDRIEKRIQEMGETEIESRDRGRRVDEGIASARSGRLCALCVRLSGVQRHRPVHGRAENPGPAAPRAVKTTGLIPRSDVFPLLPFVRDHNEAPTNEEGHMPASQAKPSKQTTKDRRIRRHARGDHRSRTRRHGAHGDLCQRSRSSTSSAVAEIDASAPGLALAKRLKIPVTRDYRMLLNLERVDLIIDVSGSAEVWQSLQDFHRMGVTILGGASAKFMWELIEARIRATAEIEKTLNKYQSLYRLYVKETGAAVTEERTRIACEIHDGLVQSLAGVGFKLELSPTTDPQRSQSQFGDPARKQGAAQARDPGSAASHLQSPSASIRQDGADSRTHQLSQVV